VFGGGVAGLTAAHELIERGFDVTLYERQAWGGCIRGQSLPHTGKGRRRDLPSEHSLHAYFGTYLNFADTLRRIPSGSNPGAAFDNLIAPPVAAFMQVGQRDLALPTAAQTARSYTPLEVRDVLVRVLLQAPVPDRCGPFR
jgi:uncharacterized protein with NAD-binding domain and iron-sulfur cluster